MLEQLRRNSRSFIIWILFAIIIAAFVFTFGTQSGLDLQGCGVASANTVMTVNDKPVSAHSLRFGMFFQRRGQTKWSQRAQIVLDQLLERELLAQAAEESGIAIDEEFVRDQVVNGKMFILGQEQDGKNAYFRDYKGQKIFDHEFLERAVQGWSLSGTDQFLTEQEREILASLMRKQLATSGIASPDEARAKFDYEQTTATVHAVKFRPSDYRRRLVLTESDVTSYLASNEDEIKKKYESEDRLYKERGPEVRVRQIMLKRVAKAPPASDGAEQTGADGAAAEEPNAGLVAARAALARVKAGEDFATVASEVSEDDRSKEKGGDLGWKSVKAPALGAKVLADELGKLDVGGISDVIETPRGFYILKVEEKREGDLTYDQVKMEIAEKMALEHYAKEGARRAAEAALAEAKAGKKLEDMFQLQAPTPQLPEGMTPEQYQQLLEQLQRQQPAPPPGNEQGSVIVESRDIPAESSWQGAEAGNTADQPAPATGQAPPPASADSPAAAGDAAAADAAAGDAATASPTGAASGSPGPAITGVTPPKLQKIGPFNRESDGMIRGLGTSEELVQAIFEDLADGDLGPKVYEVGSEMVVVQVVERKNPDPKEYDAQRKSDALRQLARQRGFTTYREWVRDRCRSLVEAGQVGINQLALESMAEESDQQFTYQPCTYVGQSFF